MEPLLEIVIANRRSKPKRNYPINLTPLVLPQLQTLFGMGIINFKVSFLNPFIFSECRMVVSRRQKQPFADVLQNKCP